MTTFSIDEKSGPDPESTSSEDKPKEAPAAVRLVALARKSYNFGVDTNGKPFAVRKGHHVAIPLLGGSNSLRKELGGYFYKISGSVASQTALTEAMEVLGHIAGEAGDPVQLHLRSAIVDDVIFIDIGDKTERVIKVSADGWELLDAYVDIPVIFRRTKVMGALPTPVPGGDLEPIWDFVNVTGAGDREVITGWLVAATILVGVPCPILALLGEQGTAKTSAARWLFSLIDPSQAAVRRPPNDADRLMHATTNSRTVVFDNLSSIPRWMSDGLCRAVTGEADVDRSLYTDDDARIIQVQGVLGFTAIDVGALAGDLAERCVWGNLRMIPKTERRSERDLGAAWGQAYPSMVGGLLDLVVKVLEKMPEVELAELPRMADFAEVLAAMDLAIGTTSLTHYTKAQESVAEDIVDSDPFIVELAAKIKSSWTGTGKTLYGLLVRPEGEKYWPKALGMSGKLRRIAPDLRKAGWIVEETERDLVSKRPKMWTLVPPGEEAVTDDELVGIDALRELRERDLAAWEGRVQVYGATRECMAAHAGHSRDGHGLICSAKGCTFTWQPEFEAHVDRSRVLQSKFFSELEQVGLEYREFEQMVADRGLRI